MSGKKTAVIVAATRFDDTLAISLAVSIMLHIAVVIWWAFTDHHANDVVSNSINLRLNAVAPTPVVPQPPAPSAPMRKPVSAPSPAITGIVETDEPVVVAVPTVREIPSPSAVNFDDLRAYIETRADAEMPTLEPAVDLAAQYKKRWHRRVQRIAQLNYPSAASQVESPGLLALNVAINTQGALAHVSVAQSSGYEPLDLAALSIVRQAAPFEPLPQNLPRTDELFQFTSTWEFRR